MQGNSTIINSLNQLLSIDLTAIDIYFVQAKILEDQGLNAIGTRLWHEMDHERSHAAKLIERILFLEGTPNLTAREEYQFVTKVPEMLALDLAYEVEAAAKLKDAIALAEKAQDFVTRELLEELLRDTEKDHIFWLETQIGLIDKVGLQNYLQAQMDQSSEGDS